MVNHGHPETTCPSSPRQPPFVNRREELTRLLNYLPPLKQTSSFVILRAPSGFGKSRLTTRLLELLGEQSVLVAAVEPQVRAKGSAQSIYQGFFIQRCAEAVDALAAKGSVLLPRFEDFLKSDRLRRARSMDWRKSVRKVPSLKTLYEVGVELVDRVFNIGDHSARKLLTSDSLDAVNTCTRYVRLLEGIAQIVMIVREAQHIDSSSLQLLSEIFHPASTRSVILEYTQDSSGALNVLFDDFISAAPLQDAAWLRIVELVQLTKPHLEELLRQTLPGSRELSGEYYLSWDGNVRAINQLRFSVSMERHPTLPQLSDIALGVVNGYRRQIASQSPTARMILCLLFAHGEAIPSFLLLLLLERLNTLASKFTVAREIETLISEELVVRHQGDALGIDNEDVTEAVRTQPTFIGLILLAKSALRDHYRDVVLSLGVDRKDVSLALRQALRLSVELEDVTTMEAMVEQLTGVVTTNIDQSWYVGQITAAVSGSIYLFAEQRDKLVIWAAELASEVADFQKACDLLRQLSTRSTFSDVLLCSCLIETGDHAEALKLAELLKISADSEESFAGELIELILLRCTGHIEQARNQWNRLVQMPDTANRRLYGYLLRFKELIEDFPACIDAVRASADWFSERGLANSSAYSELTLASHLARMGEAAGAKEAIETARTLLALTTRDQHILLNNEAAVNLLSDTPSPDQCSEWLVRGIPLAGDDYSALVLYTNLAVAAVLSGRHDIANEASERSLRILAAPKFAERNVFWGAIFNLRFVDSQLALRRGDELDRLTSDLPPHALQDEYWQYRFKRSDSVSERFSVMLSKPYHPLFLSHWTLDVDGLRTLKPEYVATPANTTSRDV